MDINDWEDYISGVAQIPQAARDKHRTSKEKVSNLIISKCYKAKSSWSNFDNVIPIANSPKSRELTLDDSSFLTKKQQKNLKRGAIKPDFIIDMHNMSVDTAFIELENLIKEGYTARKRLLLVIVGKGNNSTTNTGLLRQEIPRLINSARIKNYVTCIVTASLKHGGTGAYYLLLKNKKGDC